MVSFRDLMERGNRIGGKDGHKKSAYPVGVCARKHFFGSVYPRLLTYKVNLLLRLEALFLCQELRLAKRSIMLTTLGKNLTASALSVIARNFLIAVLVDFL